MITIGEVKRVMKRIAIVSAWEPELTYLHQYYPSERIEKTSSLGISFSLYEQFGSYLRCNWSWQSKLC